MNESPTESEWTYRPARDQNLTLRSRAVSLQREPGLIGTAVQACFNLGARAYFAACHRLEVLGRANLPAEPPFVFIANHSSHLDAVLLEILLPARRWGTVFSVAAGDTFFTSPSRSLVAAGVLNALPMWRRRRSAKHTLETLRERLCEDSIGLVIFPEGTRSRTGEIGPFKAGIGMLVAETDVPIVPAFIDGAHRCWPPSRRLPRHGRIHVRIGEPLTFRDTPNTKEGWLEVAETCRKSVLHLAFDSA